MQMCWALLLATENHTICAIGCEIPFASVAEGSSESGSGIDLLAWCFGSYCRCNIEYICLAKQGDLALGLSVSSLPLLTDVQDCSDFDTIYSEKSLFN